MTGGEGVAWVDGRGLTLLTTRTGTSITGCAGDPKWGSCAQDYKTATLRVGKRGITQAIPRGNSAHLRLKRRHSPPVGRTEGYKSRAV